MYKVILAFLIVVLYGFIQSDKPTIILKGHEWSVTDLEINKKGNLLLSGSWDKTMKLWRLSEDTAIYTFSNHDEMIWDVTFSRDEKYIASASWDGSINVYDLDSKKLIRKFKHNPKYERIQYEPFYEKRIVPNMCNTISFSPDNKFIASGSEDGIIRIWNILNGELTDTINIHGSLPVYNVMYSKSGNNLISASTKVKVYDLNTNQLTKILDGHHGSGICSMDLNNDEKYLLTGDISTHNPLIVLWDMETCDSIKVFMGHKTIIRDVCFSNNDKMFASVGEDNLIKIWDLKSGGTLKTMSDNDGKELNTICFTKTDKQIIYGSQDKTIKFRDISMIVK